MSETKGSHAQWQLLDFFCDDEDSCALTVWSNGSRYHIIADADALEEDTQAGREYRNHIQQLESASSTESDDVDSKSHQDDAPSDSGIDVSESHEGVGDAEDVALDAEERLQRWMVHPLVDSFDDTSSSNASPPKQTLHEWYHPPTHFYNLRPTKCGQSIEAVELESTKDLQERMDKLRPQAVLPKYITDNLDVPYFQASDLLVLDATDQPTGTPYHPCRVQEQVTKHTYFLKIVDNCQPQAAKREIDMLRRIAEEGLDERFRVPALEGLVSFDDVEKTATGQVRIMGFLLTEIKEPTPLTAMLHSDVPQKRRDAWAAEVQRVKNLLHEHDIIWGDAKADNFMVDADDHLWIIDFGGGYTEGWVDAPLIETEEGDNIGTEKIVNGLKDPDANVINEEDSHVVGEHDRTTSAERVSRKRKAAPEPDSDDQRPRKGLRANQEAL